MPNLFYQKLFEEKSPQNTCQKKPLAKNDWKTSTKNFWREISTEKVKITFFPNISEEKTSTKQDVKGNSPANKIWIEISSRQIPKETSTKEYLDQYMPTQKSLKRNLVEKNICREIFPLKFVQTICLTKILERFYQGLRKHSMPKIEISTKQFFKRHVPTKNMKHNLCIRKKYRKTNLYQKTWKTISHKYLWRETSTIFWTETLWNKFQIKPLTKIFEEQCLLEKSDDKSLRKNTWREISQKKWRKNPPTTKKKS